MFDTTAIDGGRQAMVFREVKAYIDARYRYPIGLRDVARAVGYSPAYLTDLVRKTTGASVCTHIRMRRIEAAQQLLAETNDTIRAIADKVGFNGTRYLAQLFKRTTGMSPTEWRERVRAERNE